MTISDERLRAIAEYEFDDLSDDDVSGMARELLAARERIEELERGWAVEP